MLKLLGIKKSFGNHDVLRNINLEGNNGKLTIIEGQNGAGKSTLFNILRGNIIPNSGKILLNSQDISHQSPKKRAEKIAVLIQDPKLSSSPSLGVLENCALALLKKRNATLKSLLRPDVTTKIKNHLTEMGIEFEKHLTKPMINLSGGQRQIFAFAMATITKPELLLLDEPTAALDDKSSHRLMELIKSLIKKWQIPTIMISHDRDLNKKNADIIFEMKGGELIKKS